MNEQAINETNETATIEEIVGQVELDENEEQDETGEQIVEVELSLEQIVDQILDASKQTEFTMYQIAKYLNKVLEVVDIQVMDKKNELVSYRIRPQMVYNYNRNKMVARNEAGKGITLTGSATLAQTRSFIIRFVAKQIKDRSN